LLACNNANTSGDAHSVETEVKDEHAVSENAPSGGLSLNNGVKWQTDESTRLHAANLSAAIDAFNRKDHQEVPEYHLFASELQTELGGLVKDCKMKGADHDALHLWLEPVMKHAGDLKTVKSVGEGKDLTDSLTGNIKKFNQYFQHAD
jgi:hypothetical protein